MPEKQIFFTQKLHQNAEKTIFSLQICYQMLNEYILLQDVPKLQNLFLKF